MHRRPQHRPDCEGALAVLVRADIRDFAPLGGGVGGDELSHVDGGGAFHQAVVVDRWIHEHRVAWRFDVLRGSGIGAQCNRGGENVVDELVAGHGVAAAGGDAIGDADQRVVVEQVVAVRGIYFHGGVDVPRDVVIDDVVHRAVVEINPDAA